MTVLFESGYSLPGPDQPLKHARIAHAGNWNAGGTITASTTAAGFSAAAPDNSLTYEKWQPTALPATWETDFGSALACDYCCIAGHNMGTKGNTLEVQYDNAGFVDVITATAITDDSPIYCIFEPETRQKFRIRITNGTVPDIGVIRFGSSLQMERPFYGGFVPPRMNRMVEVIGNKSEGGEFLGRTVIRSGVRAKYSWDNLTYAWVRTNLDTTTGLIQSMESEPIFLTWRSASEQDVEYLWSKAAVPGPAISGVRDLMSFSLEGTGHGYE